MTGNGNDSAETTQDSTATTGENSATTAQPTGEQASPNLDGGDAWKGISEKLDNLANVFSGFSGRFDEWLTASTPRQEEQSSESEETTTETPPEIQVEVTQAQTPRAGSRKRVR